MLNRTVGFVKWGIVVPRGDMLVRRDWEERCGVDVKANEGGIFGLLHFILVSKLVLGRQ